MRDPSGALLLYPVSILSKKRLYNPIDLNCINHEISLGLLFFVLGSVSRNY